MCPGLRHLPRDPQEHAGNGRPAMLGTERMNTACMAILTGLLPVCAGCPATQALPTQAAIREVVESRTQCEYLFYVPSIYSDQRPWPLVVACHGTWPFDRADLQMREWARFAEYEGIIVAAPLLVSTKGDFPPPPEKQKRLQDEDDRKILAIVDEIKNRYNVAEEQVFLTGWSAAAYPILNTGLKHPDVFRALYIRQGNFDERFLDVPQRLINKWQPIKVVYGKVDTLRDQTVASVAWLRNMGLWVEEEQVSGFHRRIDPKHNWRFFKEVIVERPWIRIRARTPDGADSLTLQFEIDAIPKAVKQKWFFGDGAESYEPSPTHAYKSAGRYQVRANVALIGGKTYSRTKSIDLPLMP